jgi:hypothetical protein
LKSYPYATATGKPLKTIFQYRFYGAHRVPDPSHNEKWERKKLKLATKPDAHLRGGLSDAYKT